MASTPSQQRRARAETLHREGRLAEADRLYAELLGEQPHDASLWDLAGILRLQAGDPEGAIERLERAAGLEHRRPDIRCRLGIALKAAGRHDEAEAALRQALARAPGMAEAMNALGGLLYERGRPEAAREAFTAAVTSDPGLVEGWCNLAGIACDAGEGSAALSHARRAVALAPHRPEPHVALGRAALLAGHAAEAESAWRAALRCEPGSAECQYGLGDSLETLGRLAEAAECYAAAHALDPQHGPALGALLMARRQLGRWEGLDALSRRFRAGVRAGMAGLSPFLTLVESEDPGLQLACARRWSAAFVRGESPAPPQAHPREEDRLVLGYLSADWYRHPTAYLTAGVLERHDRTRFRVVVFSTGPEDGSAIRRRIEAAADEFVDLRGLSPSEAAARIRASDVEVLVDLKGHTQHACTAILALRPAPVQVNYLAYCATSGAPFMDYILADREVLPAGAEAHYSEAVVRMPETFWCEDDRREPPASPPGRSACGLPEDGFVFCCFNNAWKISPPVFDAWARILAATPGSVLWLQDTAPGTPLRENLRREIARRGIGRERLVFCPRLPLAEYLGRYRLADLFLDTWPYNAHTRAADALWAGLPVLSWPGGSFASRVAASQLRAAGLPELVTAGVEDYVALATRIGTDAGLAVQLRQRVGERVRSSRLFDTPRHARQLEQVFERMAVRQRAGQPPADFDLQGS